MNAVEFKNIIKFFPPNTFANYKINLTIRKNEIHSILGENGAGKTTLMKILYGEVKPDYGEVLIYGKNEKIRSPKDAIRLGIYMVHQHFMLLNEYTVAENLALGFAKSILNPIKEIKEEATKISKKYNYLSVNLDARVWQLSAGEKQKIEILKAVYSGANILVFDEPTSVLTAPEVDGLFSTIKEFKREGKTIIFITHKLNEAIEISDRITILRRGHLIKTITNNNVKYEELSRLIIGEELNNEKLLVRKRVNKKVVLDVRNLKAIGDYGNLAVNGVSFKVHEGEIVGIGGVSGNGQRELVEVITGLRKASEGRVLIYDIDVTNKGSRKILELNVAHIPEDRIKNGIIADLNLVENSILTTYFLEKGSLIKYRNIERRLKEMIKDYDIKIPSLKSPVKYLSGGNIQKFIVARELSKKPKLIIAVHPTYGLDIKATALIREKLFKAKLNGAAVLLISENLEELMQLSDKLLIMNKGRVIGEFTPDTINSNILSLAISGVAEKV